MHPHTWTTPGGSPPTAPRRSRQRDAVLAVIDEAAGPLSPAEIHERARRHAPSIGLSTVYRLVRTMAEAGILATVELPGQAARYETARMADQHHHHFHCNACGRVFDVPGCAGSLSRLVPSAFVLEHHEIVLYGRCGDCAAPRSPQRTRRRSADVRRA